MALNKTETMAKQWLIENEGYNENDISFNPRRSPDFVCKDGRGFEVKRLYGNKLIFQESQVNALQDKDIVLVFNKDGFIDSFKWKDKENIRFIIQVLDATTLTLTEGTKKDLDDLKIHPRQAYEEVIKTIIKKYKGEPSPAQDQGDASNSDEET